MFISIKTHRSQWSLNAVIWRKKYAILVSFPKFSRGVKLLITPMILLQKNRSKSRISAITQIKTQRLIPYKVWEMRSIKKFKWNMKNDNLIFLKNTPITGSIKNQGCRKVWWNELTQILLKSTQIGLNQIQNWVKLKIEACFLPDNTISLLLKIFTVCQI